MIQGPRVTQTDVTRGERSACGNQLLMRPLFKASFTRRVVFRSHVDLNKSVHKYHRTKCSWRTGRDAWFAVLESELSRSLVATGRGTKQLLYVRRQTLVATSAIVTAKTRRCSAQAASSEPGGAKW